MGSRDRTRFSRLNQRYWNWSPAHAPAKLWRSPPTQDPRTPSRRPPPYRRAPPPAQPSEEKGDRELGTACHEPLQTPATRRGIEVEPSAAPLRLATRERGRNRGLRF